MSTLGYAEGYVAPSVIDDVASDHLLVPAVGAENVVIRLTPRPMSDPVPWLLVVADLAEGTARERSQARTIMRKYARPEDWAPRDDEGA